MSKTIDLEVLLLSLRIEGQDHPEKYGFEWGQIMKFKPSDIEIIADKYAVTDAVRVVRCKDCKHYYFAENRVPEEQSWVCDAWHENQTNHMGYCFKAERKRDADMVQ